MKKIILGKTVSVLEDRAEHIAKHNLNMSIDDIVAIADKFTKGEIGLHECHYSSQGLITIVIRGQHQENGNNYGMVRTIWKGGAGRKNEGTGLPIIQHTGSGDLTCNKHGIIPYSHGFCPWCELNLNEVY